MQKIKRNLHLVVIFGILFATGAVFADVISGQSKIGVSLVSADEEKQEKIEVKDDEDDKNEVKSKESKKENDDVEEKISENLKKKTKDFKTKELRTAAKNDDTEDQEDEVDEEDSDEVDDEENGKDAQEGIWELKKDINKIESRISVLSANGVVTTSFTAALSEIKNLAVDAETRVMTASAESEILIKNADKKLERLEKLIKMAMGDDELDEEDDETGKDAAEKIQEATREAGSLEIKLITMSEAGNDVSALKASLNAAKDLLFQANEKLISGDFVTAESLAKMADKKIEVIKHSMELAYDDDDEEDGDEANEYKNEVAKFVQNLEKISQIDGSIGKQVMVVAQAQNASVAKVENSINDIKSRGGFVKFLVGPKYDSISEVQSAIVENQNRINVLSGLIEKTVDPMVKQVLQEQVGQFQQENARLQSFIAENEDGVSLFGWLAKMLS